MKGFIICTLLITFVAAQNEVVDDKASSLLLRITGGTKAKPKLVPSFVALQIFYDHGIKTCGGFLGPAANQVITAARCVFDGSEGKANTIKFAFGQSSNFKINKIKFTDIYRTKTFVSTSNTSADDLAVIYLASNVKTSPTVAVATPSVQATADFFVGQNLVTCGFGDLDNYRNRSTSLFCTTLRVVPVAECAATPIAGTICTKNVDTANVCGSDFGAPAFSNSSGKLEVVGVVSFYPDSKANARCQDGHYAVLTQLGNQVAFLAAPTTVGTNLY